MTLLPPDVASDPDKLRAMWDKLDAEQYPRRRDQQTVEDIACASGMSSSGSDNTVDQGRHVQQNVLSAAP